MTDKRPCVYILASRRNGTLYVGVTNDLARRVAEHRADAVAGLREKRIKRWRGVWKLEAIERQNPGWRDLADDLAS